MYIPAKHVLNWHIILRKIYHTKSWWNITLCMHITVCMTVCCIFSYMTDIQTNFFNVVYLVSGGITAYIGGVALNLLNSRFYLSQSEGYHYVATTFAGSLITILFLVRLYMYYIYSFIENHYYFNCKYWCQWLAKLLYINTIIIQLTITIQLKLIKHHLISNWAAAQHSRLKVISHSM